MGFGTQFTDDEFSEGERIVDAPVERRPAPPNSNGSRPPAASNNANNETDTNATEQQISSIRKLCLHLRKSEPENVTSISFLAAKKLIQQLTAEYKESRQNKVS